MYRNTKQYIPCPGSSGYKLKFMEISEVIKLWATKNGARLRKEANTGKNNINEKDQRIKLSEDYTNYCDFPTIYGSTRIY